MRCILTFALLLGTLSLVGCESADSLPTRVRERFEPAQPKTRVYAAEQRAVFDAAQRAMKRIDFQVSRAGAAQGVIKAHSPLHPGDSFGKARQYTLEVHVQSFEPGTTQVSVVLREQEESESFAGATDIALREHGLYESYFGALEAELGQKAADDTQPVPGM